MSDELLRLFEELDDSEEVREGYKKCPLNFTGSKRDTLGDILDLLPYKTSWVDVFGGSGIVTICRKPSKLDVFNDRHSGITDFYRAIREDYDRLAGLIELMPHSREQFVRSKTEKNPDHFVRGANWYYLVQASFAGRGQYFGRVTSGSNTVLRKLYGNLELFPSVHRRFKEVTVENLDWRSCFKDYDSFDTVFYCDPPYIGGNVYEYNMSMHEHRELCDKIFTLDGFVALSGFDNTIYNEYDWDGKHVFDIQNRISSDGSTRDKKRLECLWIKEAG